MPANDWISTETSTNPVPPPPPDTARVFAIVAPAAPAGVTAVVSSYSTLAEMADDGWGTGFAAYNAVARLLEQTPTDSAVSAVKVIKRETAVANVWTIDINSTEDGDHIILIGGVVAATFNASGSTATEIKDGLEAAFNLGPFATAQTAATVDPDTLSLTADVAGIPFTPTVVVPSGTPHTVTETVANVGIYDDLEAAYPLAPFWGVLTPAALDVEIDEARRWVQADTATRRCFLFGENSDAGVYDDGDTDNLAVLWVTAKHPRVNLLSHPISTDYMQAAAVGRLGGQYPGRRAWHYLALAGSVETEITSDRSSGETATMRTRRVSYTERLYGPLSDLLLLGGYTPSGHFIYQRWAEDQWWYVIRATIDAAMKANSGVDLDLDGLQSVVDLVSQAMIPMVTEGTLAADFIVTHNFADVPAGEIAVGNFATTGRILAEATITPKLRAMRARAEFNLV